MNTIAKRKARLNGWIKTYQDRIEQAKQTYGAYSVKFKVTEKYLKFKINGWQKEYQKLCKAKAVDKAKICKFIEQKTIEYFGEPLVYDNNRYFNIDNTPNKYYISKFIVDNGLASDESAFALGTKIRAMRNRRDALTENKDHKNAYRAYKLTMESELQAAKIVYK